MAPVPFTLVIFKNPSFNFPYSLFLSLSLGSIPLRFYFYFIYFAVKSQNLKIKSSNWLNLCLILKRICNLVYCRGCYVPDLTLFDSQYGEFERLYL